ncbi:MAG: hypothetical protein MUP85_15595 [Candidatus Lokiarchaeota archaeon]|nr:hypothetical protein [Candidatus Lokiarchaeota archaeon]
MTSNISLTYINVIVSATVLLFIIWDHLKDDRQLTRQIQTFYSDLEMLIYSYIQIKYYNTIEKKEIDESDLKTLNKTKNRDMIQNSYLKKKIKQNFNKFSNYLGLTLDEETNSYLNNTIYVLGTDGLLKRRNFENNTVEEVINSYIDITSKELEEIQKFLSSTRFFWNKNFKKLIFRTHLKSQLNFREVLGSSIPLQQTRKRSKF